MKHSSSQEMEQQDEKDGAMDGNEGDNTDQETTPLQDVLDDLDGMMQDPSSVTKESLSALRDKVESIKEEIEKEETDEGESMPMGEKHGGKGILVAIGMPKGGGGK